MTPEEFQRRLDYLHGAKWNLESFYTGLNDPLTFHCALHGKFETTGRRVLKGTGCPFCFRMKKKTTRQPHMKTFEDFVDRSRECHGDRYTYVDFESASKPTNVICKRHGSFSIVPSQHVDGRNCPKCHRHKISGRDSFVKRANSKYLGKYSYDGWAGSEAAIGICCPEHGVFQQTPAAHLQGLACPKCNETSLAASVCDLLTGMDLPIRRNYVVNSLFGSKYLPFTVGIPSLRIVIDLHPLAAAEHQEKTAWAKKSRFQYLSVRTKSEIEEIWPF